MSEVQASAERFFVLDNWTTLNAYSRWVVGECGKAPAVDMYRSRSAAEYACMLLNRGVARIDRHAIVGCRVVAS